MATVEHGERTNTGSNDESKKESSPNGDTKQTSPSPAKDVGQVNKACADQAETGLTVPDNKVAKEKSKSPAKEVDSAGASPPKVAETTTKDETSSSASGIVHATVDAVKQIVGSVVEKVQDAYASAVGSHDTADTKSEQADKTPTSTKSNPTKKEEKTKGKRGPTSTVKATEPDKAASPSKEEKAQETLDSNNDVDMPDATKEVASEKAPVKPAVAEKAERRGGPTGPRKPKEAVPAPPPESLRRSTRNTAKSEPPAKKRPASPPPPPAKKSATAAANGGGAAKNTRRK